MAENEAKPRFMTIQWFKPLYRRVIVVGIVAAWCAWEWLVNNNDQYWGFITLAALAYAVWTFFINFEKEVAKDENGRPKS
jgi:hypothetical protein